jgi:hypothetical protein
MVVTPSGFSPELCLNTFFFLITSAYTYREGVVTPTDPKGKEGEILLSRALGGLRDEGRHGQKTKKFFEIFFKISIINISASKPNI